MRFEIRGHFEAEDIDDAIARLALHFTALDADGDDVRSPLHDAPMQLDVRPAQREDAPNGRMA